MTAVATSAAVYSAVHFIKDSPDFNWRKDLRADEEQESEWLRERAQQNQNSIYRKLASLRDRTVSLARLLYHRAAFFLSTRLPSLPATAVRPAGPRRSRWTNEGHPHLAHLNSACEQHLEKAMSACTPWRLPTSRSLHA
jgi:hypothetical protein